MKFRNRVIIVCQSYYYIPCLKLQTISIFYLFTELFERQIECLTNRCDSQSQFTHTAAATLCKYV